MKRYIRSSEDAIFFRNYRGYDIMRNFIHEPSLYIIYNGKQKYFDSIEDVKAFIDGEYDMSYPE